jgi:ABC-type multidrug transport system fused ATPase/permease subunit
LSLLLILATGLFVASPNLAAVLVVFFILTGFFSFRNLSGKARSLGTSLSGLSIKSNSKVIEVLSAFRETVVKGRQAYYAAEIQKVRSQLTDVYAEIHFLPMVSKYVIEISVIIGAIIMAVFQILITDATNAVASLTLFLVAATRMAPSALRVQQGLLQIKSGLGMAMPSIELIKELSECTATELSGTEIQGLKDFSYFEAGIEVQGVSFTYQDSTTPAVQNVSVSISAGSRVAIVGASGAGKSTLADLILGVLKQDGGDIQVGGLTVEEVIVKWPGSIAYVPQDVVIIDGTIRENISMGYPRSVSADEHILNTLKLASLSDFLKEKALGIETPIGDSGTKLSGGERQRIGIARALFTSPKILILDEATSSLDASTEAIISQTIESLHGTTTVILIAHRLSTVRDADQVIYMSEGEILAVGKFEEVRKLIPDFDSQAKLMGL